MLRILTARARSARASCVQDRAGRSSRLHNPAPRPCGLRSFTQPSQGRHSRAFVSRDTRCMSVIPPAAARPVSTWVARALLAIAVILLRGTAKPLMLPVVIAVAFTFVLAAPVRWLRRHGVPDYAGAFVVIGSV